MRKKKEREREKEDSLWGKISLEVRGVSLTPLLFVKSLSSLVVVVANFFFFLRVCVCVCKSPLKERDGRAFQKPGGGGDFPFLFLP